MLSYKIIGNILYKKTSGFGSSNSNDNNSSSNDKSSNSSTRGDQKVRGKYLVDISTSFVQ